MSDKELLLQSVYALGKNFCAQGKYKKALIIFDGLMALAPENKEYAIAFGESLFQDGQTKRALDHFLKLFERFELDSRTLLGAAKSCILFGRKEEAQNFLRPILEGEVYASERLQLLARSILAATRASECMHSASHDYLQD